MSKVKVAWYFTIDEHVGYILYDEAVLREHARRHGPRITKVDRVVTDWTGEHDGGTRGFRILDRRDVTESIKTMGKI